MLLFSGVAFQAFSLQQSWWCLEPSGLNLGSTFRDPVLPAPAPAGRWLCRAEALCPLRAHAPPHTRRLELQFLSRHAGLSSGSESLTPVHS